VFSRGSLSDIEARLTDLERKVEHLYRHLGGELPAVPELWELAPGDVVGLARDGKKIEAIKAYRKATGCDLATAKRVVESIPR
jgi:ribosomal protein L7/L12